LQRARLSKARVEGLSAEERFEMVRKASKACWQKRRRERRVGQLEGEKLAARSVKAGYGVE